jgi:hypothetical protein
MKTVFARKLSVICLFEMLLDVHTYVLVSMWLKVIVFTLGYKRIFIA